MFCHCLQDQFFLLEFDAVFGGCTVSTFLAVWAPGICSAVYMFFGFAAVNTCFLAFAVFSLVSKLLAVETAQWFPHIGSDNKSDVLYL